MEQTLTYHFPGKLMFCLLPILFGAASVLPGQSDQIESLRHWRLGLGKPVLVSELDITRTDEGTQFLNRLALDQEKVRLGWQLDRKGTLTAAEAEQQTPLKKTVVLSLHGKRLALLKRDRITDFLKDLPARTVVITDPEWSGAFQLARYYDFTRKGKQEYTGLLMHPSLPARVLPLNAEWLRTDTVLLKDKDGEQEVKLDRLQMRLVGGDNLVWVDSRSRVVKILPLRMEAAPVVLEGYEEATRGLRP